MIISRTPFRISFLGGGTDYPAWYRQHGGVVLGTTIDKYCYLTCRRLPPFFEHRFRLVYSKIENCESVEDIRHPSIRAVLSYLKINRGLEIHHDGDLPARSGMGSSSAFTVGLLNAMHALEGRMVSKQQVLNEALHIEQEVLQETVGSQDQVMAAFGGFSLIHFRPSGEIVVSPVTLPAERIRELNSHLMLFFSGIRRTACDVASTFVNNLEKQRRHLRIMADLVHEGLAVLSSRQDISVFGELLHEAWVAKRKLSDAVTNSDVDAIYEDALAAGASGGKLLGAGGGGFILFCVAPDRQARLREALSHLVHVPFKFESSGSQIIYFDRDCEYADEENARNNGHFAAFRELAEKPDFA